MNYREQQRLPSAYRGPPGMREPYPVGAPPAPMPRASSPPYKILCVTNIDQKIADGQVKDALTSDFSGFGDVSVSICHDSGERLAYIYFRNYDEARDARHTKTRTLFFDRPIEIEPIYEPHTEGSPVDSPPPQPHHMVQPPVPQMYSPPRRRSMTPPDYPHPHDMNGPMLHRRQAPPPPHMQRPHGPPPPMPHHNPGMSPPDYAMPMAHMAGYPHGPSPPPMGPAHMAHDRRGGYGPGDYGGYPLPHPPLMQHSPYSSPPHDPYRSPYPPYHPYFNHPYSSGSPYGNGPPPPQPPPQIGRAERDRMYNETSPVDSRSPRSGDPYYLMEPRGGYPSPRGTPHSSGSGHYPPPQSLSPGIYPPPNHQSSYRSPPPNPSMHHHHHHHNEHRAPDPPARYLSREFRREKFGGDHHGGDHDDGRPSRVLLINNIDSKKTESEVRETFEPFGIIEEMEVKKVAPQISSALIKFSSMDGAYKAKTAINGRYIGDLKCRIVYGKVTASRRLWIGGLSPNTTVPCLEDDCSRFGNIVSMEYTSGRPYAYVLYESANQAQFAAHHLRTVLMPAPERKIRIEFVDPERSEKLLSRNDSSSHTSDARSKSRGMNESWAVNESEPSLQSVSVRKRSLTPPTDASGCSKRACQTHESPIVGANTFKQERLAAAAAAVKARTSSSATSPLNINHHHGDETDKKTRQDGSGSNELNNNSDNQQAAGNGNLGNSSERPETAAAATTKAQASDAPSLISLSECTNIREIVDCCPVHWLGQLALRNFTFPSKIYLCSGRKQLINKYLSKLDGCNAENGSGQQYPILRITQRWRLHPQPKLEEVKRRMQLGNLGMLIITSHTLPLQNQSILSPDGKFIASSAVRGEQMAPVNCSEDQQGRQDQLNGDESKKSSDGSSTGQHKGDESSGGSTSAAMATASATTNAGDGNSRAVTQGAGSSSNQATQPRPLRNLISYLEQKDAAGVISLGPSDGSSEGASSDSKLLYAFPPGDFALNLIKRKASNLSDEATKEEFLLGVIVGNETKM